MTCWTHSLQQTYRAVGHSETPCPRSPLTVGDKSVSLKPIGQQDTILPHSVVVRTALFSAVYVKDRRLNAKLIHTVLSLGHVGLLLRVFAFLTGHRRQLLLYLKPTGRCVGPHVLLVLDGSGDWSVGCWLYVDTCGYCHGVIDGFQLPLSDDCKLWHPTQRFSQTDYCCNNLRR